MVDTLNHHDVLGKYDKIANGCLSLVIWVWGLTNFKGNWKTKIIIMVQIQTKTVRDRRL